MNTVHIQPADIVVLALYFGAILGVGLFFSKKNINTEEYFLGGRSFPGWALGLSLLGTCMSSITFIALPADGFKTTFIRQTMTLAFPATCAFAAFVLLPFFRRGTITSAYEYLAHRFGPSVSCYAASMFFLLQTVRISSILYLISLIIQSVTGLNFIICMLLAGGITALYTVSGGFDAVIWTDVIQTITLVIGAGIIIGVILHQAPQDFDQLISTAWNHGKLSYVRDLNVASGKLEPLAHGFLFTERTFRMLLLVGVVQYLTMQFDQTSIQRWCSAKSAKEAKKAIGVLAACSIPVWSCFTFVGTMLWAFFHFNPDTAAAEMLSGIRKAEEIVPYFITRYVPAGLSGLVMAGALAAAMSSLSSSINAASMVWVRDIYKPYIVKSKPDTHYLKVGFAASSVVSVLMLCGAYLFYTTTTKTLTELTLILGCICGGGMVAVFLVGVFTRLGNSKAVWAGLISNAVFTSWLLLGNRGAIPEHFALHVDLYYSALAGNLLTFIVIALSGIRLRHKNKDFTNLTVWDQEHTPLV